MGDNTAISWTEKTFSPWLGCSKVSTGCKNCYIVRTVPFRMRGIKHGDPRQRTVGTTWKQPLRWNAEAKALGVRVRVFPSLLDWLDDEVPAHWLADFLELISKTPWLDWQLLTKRPQNFQSRLQAVLDIERPGSHHGHLLAHSWQKGIAPRNVQIGASVEDQSAAHRIALVSEIPALVRFLSCEPLLGAIALPADFATSIHWVIAGGESGKEARPMNPDWVRCLRDQCAVARVAFHFKQWGEWLAAKLLADGSFQLQFHKDATGPKRPRFHHWPDCNISARVGKKAAGRLLDGIEHNALPPAPMAWKRPGVASCPRPGSPVAA